MNKKSVAIIIVFLGICGISWFDATNKFKLLSVILWIISCGLIWCNFLKIVRDRIKEHGWSEEYKEWRTVGWCFDDIVTDILTVLLVGFSTGIIFATCMRENSIFRLLGDTQDFSAFITYAIYKAVETIGCVFIPAIILSMIDGAILCKFIGKNAGFLTNVSLIAGYFLSASHVFGVIDLNIMVTFFVNMIKG